MLRMGLAAVSLCSLTGCPIDRFSRYDRPAHAEMGFNTRHFPSDPTKSSTARETPGAMTTSDVAGTSMSIDFRFTMRTRWSTYMGVEAEAGAFAGEAGSNLAGAYGVFGAAIPRRHLTLSPELAIGWRGMRAGVEADDHDVTVLEPRVRGELWLSPVITLGAAAGAEVTGEHAWMAGIYLGVHSHNYGRDTPRR